MPLFSLVVIILVLGLSGISCALGISEFPATPIIYQTPTTQTSFSGQIVSLYGLESLGQGGNKLTLLLPNGKKLEFSTNEWTIQAISWNETGVINDYSQYINYWQGPDPIGLKGEAWIFKDSKLLIIRVFDNQTTQPSPTPSQNLKIL